MKRNRNILQANRPQDPKTLVCTFGVELQAAEGEGENKLPRFKITAYTGGPMQANFFSPVVVDLGGLKASRSKLPILLDHDASRIVGQADKVDIKPTGVELSGVITGTDADAQKVVSHARNGFEWQASIGAAVTRREFLEAGKKATVNGREVTGPLVIAREAQLREVSFVAMGADENTTASVAASQQRTTTMDPKFAEWLKAKGFDPDTLTDGAKTFLQAQYDTEIQAAAGRNGGQGGAGSGNTDLDGVLEATRKKQERKQKIVDLTAAALQEDPDNIEMIKALSQQAIEGDWDSQRYELELLRARRPKINARGSRTDGEKLTGQVIEAALCLGGGIDKPEEHYSEQVLEAASKRFRHGLGIGEVLRLFARYNGYIPDSSRDLKPLLKAAFMEPDSRMLMASAPSSLSLPGILGNVANKFLRLGFESVEPGWEMVSAKRPVRDFKEIATYTLTGDFKFKKVAPGGQLKHATPGEQSYTNQADTHGILFALDRRDLINDDLGALTSVPRRLGRGGKLNFLEIFWTEFLEGHSPTSSTGFFPTNGSKGNYFAGATPGSGDTRMNIEGLTVAEKAFFSQTDPDGNPLGMVPKILLVPPALAATASVLMRSAEIRDNTASTQTATANPHAGKFSVVMSSYLANSAMSGGYSAAAWYLLADPQDVPFIETVFLNGVEVPTVEQADADFNTLGIQMRGYMDFGVNKQEYRAAVKMKGAA